MPNCYKCGRPLKESRWRYRRRVPTGEWVRRGYGGERVTSVQKRFGMRVVCRGCARWIDARDARSERNQWLQLAAAFLVLLLILLLG